MTIEDIILRFIDDMVLHANSQPYSITLNTTAMDQLKHEIGETDYIKGTDRILFRHAKGETRIEEYAPTIRDLMEGKLKDD